MPFMFFKVTSIINTEERKERLKQRTLIENKKKGQNFKIYNWIDYVPEIKEDSMRNRKLLYKQLKKQRF